MSLCLHIVAEDASRRMGWLLIKWERGAQSQGIYKSQLLMIRIQMRHLNFSILTYLQENIWGNSDSSRKKEEMNLCFEFLFSIYIASSTEELWAHFGSKCWGLVLPRDSNSPYAGWKQKCFVKKKNKTQNIVSFLNC